MDSYVIIPLIAVSSYFFLLLAFLAAKKNAIINSFIGLLLASIAWTGGSLLMRTHFINLDLAWYNISFLGIVFLPLAFLIFIKSFAGLKKTIIDMFIFVSCFVMVIINTYTGYFLKMPNLVVDGDGKGVFVYSASLGVVFLFIILTSILVRIFKVIIANFREDNSKSSAIKPIKMGLIILFFGNFLTIIPILKGFPIDILSGVFFVFTLFYSMYKKKLFELDLLISKAVVYGFSAVISIAILINTITIIENFLEKYCNLVENRVLIISVIFTLIAFMIYRLMEIFIDKIYVSGEAMRNDVLRKFKNTAFSSLEVSEISKMIINLIKDTLKVNEVYVLLPQTCKEHSYKLINTSNPLNKINFSLDVENPLVKVLTENNECLLIENLKQLNAYKSMWIEEKKQLLYLGIECFVPLIDDNELIGILMISGKERSKKINYNDTVFLEGVSMISSASLRKAQLYEKVYNEARRDDLTNLLNRKYFLANLEEFFVENSKDLISLAIFDIDDFKLYNQLYGNSEGDRILENIAKILEASMEGIGFCARYDSKVFACVFPRYDLNQTKLVVEKIVKQINQLNVDSDEYQLKKITVSCGISIIPFLANNTKDLINDAELAVYYVKRNGKNNIRISTGQIVKKNPSVEMGIRKSRTFSEYSTTIHALTATINTKDQYTYSHSNNVAYYATELASNLDMDEDSIEIIREAALLHDIGKIGIEENILNKAGMLTPEERIIMQSHVEKSVSIIKHLPSLTYLIPAVIGHHERWDGNGYPRRIKGNDIPLFARILCIADSFDAMISRRPYKNNRSVDFALAEIEKGSGKQFDPELATIFIDLVKNKKLTPILDD